MERHTKDTWTVFKIMGEFVEGFETLRAVWPSVSIFGGARCARTSRLYRETTEIAESLSRAGFTVITGGGPGLMEAANKGANRAGGHSIGLNIKLPEEQDPNRFSDTTIHFNYFFARKVMFMKYAVGIVGLPGGFGTLDEIFEALTLVQTRKIEGMPVVLYGSSFWRGLVQWIESQPVRHRLLRKRDLRLLHITDDRDEVTEIIHRHHVLEQQRMGEEAARGHVDL